MTIHAPLFTVVVPTYDRSDTILPTLRSVAAQTFVDLECIVVDDGSHDGDALAHVVASLDDARFRLIRQENAGGGKARNTGILAAKGRWIALLDSDDSFDAYKLETVAGAIETGGEVSMVYHPALVDRGGGRHAIRPSRPMRDGEGVLDFTFRDREFVQTSTIVVRSDVAKAVLFDPALRKAQDIDFLMRVQKADPNFLYVPRTLSVWNDVAVTGRVGAPRRPESVISWYEANRSSFDPKTARAFEATYLSYEIAATRPLKALAMLVRGAATRSISPKAFVQASVRAFVPQPIYRRIVDAVATKRTDPVIVDGPDVARSVGWPAVLRPETDSVAPKRSAPRFPTRSPIETELPTPVNRLRPAAETESRQENAPRP